MANKAPSAKVQELLAKARANLAAKKAAELTSDDQPFMEKSELPPTSQDRIQKLMQEIKEGRKQAEAKEEAAVPVATTEAAEIAKECFGVATEEEGELEYNEKQEEAVTRALNGESFCLIGQAGTGKTATVRRICRQLILSGRVGFIKADTKYLHSGRPAISVHAFTRRATTNVRKQLPVDIRSNCITVHKLLEFEPTNVMNEEGKEVLRFMPRYNRQNKLPGSLRVMIFEESAMISTELFASVIDALPDPKAVQFIFLGDLNQLPPVYGDAILGYKLLELPVVELTHVYRQALKSPIIRLATHIRHGNIIPMNEVKEGKWNEETEDGKLTIIPWTSKVDATKGLLTMGAFFTKAIDAGKFDPETDMILCPFNKEFGTIELNKLIQNHLGKKRGAIVHEVIAGFSKHYLAEGDRIMFDKEDATIVRIAKNPKYMGTKPQIATTTLDRWGIEHGKISAELREQDAAEDLVNIDKLLFATEGAMADIEDKTNQASHIVTVKMSEDDSEVFLNTAGEINLILGGNALTVHKAQGCEWERVFLLIHSSHAVATQRELLYTGITRARQELTVICELTTFIKGVASQKIRGNTLAEKAEYFKGKQERKRKELQL